VGGVLNEVGSVDVEGKALGEEVSKDCKLVGSGVIEPVGRGLLSIGGLSNSGTVRFLLHFDHACDVFKEGILNVSDLFNPTFDGGLKNNWVSISISGHETFICVLVLLFSSSLDLVDLLLVVGHGLGHCIRERVVEVLDVLDEVVLA